MTSDIALFADKTMQSGLKKDMYRVRPINRTAQIFEIFLQRKQNGNTARYNVKRKMPKKNRVTKTFITCKRPDPFLKDSRLTIEYQVLLFILLPRWKILSQNGGSDIVFLFLYSALTWLRHNNEKLDIKARAVAETIFRYWPILKIQSKILRRNSWWKKCLVNWRSVLGGHGT